MAKKQHSIKLHGINDNGLSCNTNQADDVQAFIDGNGEFNVCYSDDLPNAIWLTVDEGSYVLKKHATMNYYHGVCGGIKVQVSLKKIVGEIRYWA